MTRKEEILQMRNEGLTWQKIGEHYGISRQRAQQIFSGIRFQEKNYKERNRHKFHVNKPKQKYRKPCSYCEISKN
jgi:DNA-directed RNA polymerase sigma subunit (sigma70/sigma32)